jgi:type VI secretion system protein ImpK
MDRITWLTKDCFHAVSHLRLVADSPASPPAQVYARMRGYVDAMMSAARDAGMPQEDVTALAYAICALADEVVLTRAGALRDHWVHAPLQLVYFNDNRAGEAFFEHLERLSSDPRRTDVLRVYYLALCLGFRGRYQARGAEADLAGISDKTRAALERRMGKVDAISPDGLRPDDVLARVGDQVPIVALSVGAAVLTGLVYVGMGSSLRSAMDEMLRWLSGFVQG